VIAAALTGAVVIVVGYASGLGLNTTSAGADGSVSADGGQPATVQQPQPDQQPLPSGDPPPPNAVRPMPPVPAGTTPPADVPATVPPVNDPGSATPPVDQQPPVTDPTQPAPTSPPGAPPPGTPPVACQPGIVGPLLDTVTGLPLVGGLTTGLGLTGPSGVLAAVVGSCPAAVGEPVLPLNAVAVQPPVPTPAGGG
jgi:hypothetical protein